MEITDNNIKNHIPYYLTQNPEKLIEALRDLPYIKNFYTNCHLEERLQGDGWNCLEIINFVNGDRKLIQGILLSNTCDIDTNNKRDFEPNITFAPILKLKKFIDLLRQQNINSKRIEEKIRSIKEQRVTTLFYLPANSKLETDYIAQLDKVYTVPIKSFDQRTESVKLFTLSQEGFYLFLFKLSVHFCRFHEGISRNSE